MPKKKSPTRSKSKSAREPDDLSFLSGGGEMGERMRAFDWSTSPVGPVADWPQSLKTAVSICIGSRYPIVIWWGHPAYTMFYNDGYIPILGVTKHPGWLGRSGREAWKDIWSTVGPMLDSVFETGLATWSEDLLLVMDRNIPHEETYFTFSYSPIRGANKVDGIFCACYETTSHVVGERRLQTLRDLGRTVIEVKTVKEACDGAVNTLAANSYDVPFALIYLLDDDSPKARLVCSRGVETSSTAAPPVISLDEPVTSGIWPLRSVFESGENQLVTVLTAHLDSLPGGPWPESTETALILPIASPGSTAPTGFLVAGLSPRRVLDDEYRNFFDVVARHISTAITNARAYQEQRKRAEALAEIDRAKTLFFSNVSHEFRTPLTLMLGPLEDTLADQGLSAETHERLEVAHRNSLRLLKLVNTLLDFSRIEAGRIEAVYDAVDLATTTAELASVFRSAIEKAGLSFVVDCAPIESTVYVDREMWEKIVFNLLSNAFKFTFDGEIRVTLRETGGIVELEVSDTGTGIPEAELPHLFERFHRVKGARGRSYEGSGIGLALVLELVKLHGGTVRVTSEVGNGSKFTVCFPTGAAHLPPDRLGGPRTLASTGLRSEAYVDEVLKWLPENGTRFDDLPSFASAADLSTPAAGESRARVLLADDNADMREYLRRLLATKYDVEAVGDGEAALEATRKQPFDLVLSDVMMPKLDGFGLLKALRAEEKMRTIPIILLSARAGEESRLEGMGAGADDYLVKPFSARELLARVEAHLNLLRVRRESEEAVLQLIASEQKARASAEIANRVKDDFLAMLSHELRTPLNAIVGWTHLLKKGSLSETDRDRGIDVIHRNATAQRAIIDELLDISRIVTGKLKLEGKPVELTGVIEAAIDAVRPAADAKSIKIVTAFDPNAGLVVGEALRLQQVIWNLLSNAVKFTPREGRIDVELRVAGNNVEVVISDTGEGIDPEFLPYIFERFRQADTSSKRMHGGLGLGLSIVRSLVEMHRGEISAASEGNGKGSTFTMTLPVMGLSDFEAAAGAPADASAEWLARGWQPQAQSDNGGLKSDLLSGVKVLAVDDQQDTRELITLALGRYGAEVRVSDSAATALELIRDWKPHVVVSDIGMPGMDGYDFMRQLRAIEGDGERIPAIAVTGYAGVLDESKALNAGYEVHLSKPIELNELAAAIARVSRRTE